MHCCGLFNEIRDSSVDCQNYVVIEVVGTLNHTPLCLHAAHRFDAKAPGYTSEKPKPVSAAPIKAISIS